VAENVWRTVGENAWRTMGENLWRIVTRKLTTAFQVADFTENDIRSRVGAQSFTGMGCVAPRSSDCPPNLWK